MGFDRDQPLMNIGQAVRIMAGFALDHQRGTLGIGGQHRFEGGRYAAWRILCNIAQTSPARHINRPGIGLQHSRDHPDQCGLARAIAADQSDAPARRQIGGGAVEDRAPAKANRNVEKIEHGARLE